MHDSSYQEMRSVFDRYLGKYTDKKIRMVDVGSKDFNGSYRSLISPGWKYIGVDTEQGKNVDIVLEDAYHLPFKDNSVDMVISGQYIEHVKRPWVLLEEIARILDPGGACFITAAAKNHLHGYPGDYWRIYPEGMRILLEDAGFTVLEIYTVPVDGLLVEQYEKHSVVDCWGIGVKKR